MTRLPPLPGRTDTRIDALMTLLATRPMLVINGARIAREIGVTRGAVWQWVGKLRSLGVRVKGVKGAGYRVEQAPDTLVPGLLKPRLRRTIYQGNLHHLFKTGSTNDVAMALGQQGAPHGTVVIAEEQTAGRGRLGRKWYSEKASGIYASILLRPALPPPSAPMLTLAAGLAARHAVAEQTGLAPDIRWPNDLLLNGRKFAGILTEMQAEPDRIQFVVTGVGINVNHERFPDDLGSTATSLRIETKRVHSRLELLVKLLLKLEDRYNRLITAGPGPLVDEFTRVSSFALGKRVQVRTATETFTGTTDGLEPNGLLRVRREGGRVDVVVAGEVRETA
ncbi:MAG TPA: biotin--[acetyl-CoA-carboxylase] ligase [Candidatus Acidoferrales bacterium]|nr:biotin--[acetyl-CoA-carboxylase] ligase [Candidatus Acidoferrales bacterium]